MTEDKNNLADQKNNERPIPSVDKQEIADVEEVIRLLSKTISTIKIFQPEHATVKNQIEDLWVKLAAFLEKHQVLEIEIQELTFLYKNNPIYREKKTIKSLPFLLYKDGMQKLSFYKGIKKEELQEFMEIVKNVYELPPEESDIVNLLWEKDFANIRFFAPDEFLETKIGIGKKPLDIEVDREALFSGMIELLSEDKAELQSAREEPDILEEEIPDGEELWEESEFGEQSPTLTEQENRILDAMLTANRQVTPEDELVLLITEMLNLEEDSERFNEILTVISHMHKDLILKGDFTRAYQLLSNTLEIKMITAYESKDKESLVNNFLQKLRTKDLQELIKKPLLDDKVEDFRFLFAYLDLLLESDALPLLAELYDKVNSPEFRKRSLSYFKEKAAKNPEILARIADDSRTELTKEVIAILSAIPEKRAIQGFAVFIHSKNKANKTEAIKSLGKFKDITSKKILLGFLSDSDENIRIMAAHQIAGSKDDSIIEQVIPIVVNKNIRQKSRKEQQAIFDILGRSETTKAYETIAKILTKLTFFSRSKNTQVGLCAIRTIQALDSEKSRQILEQCRHSKNRKIREACGAAIENLSPHQGEKGQEHDRT